MSIFKTKIIDMKTGDLFVNNGQHILVFLGYEFTFIKECPKAQYITVHYINERNKLTFGTADAEAELQLLK